MEDGRYRARAVAGALGYTSNDRPQIAITFEVTVGECMGEQISWYGYFTDASHERTFAALRMLGWEGDDLSNLAGIDKNEVSITVKSEEYEGAWHQKVAWINPLGGAALKKPMTPEQQKVFAAQMKGAAVVSRGGGKPKPASRPQQQRQSPPARTRQHREHPDPEATGIPGALDDDIPF